MISISEACLLVNTKDEDKIIAAGGKRLTPRYTESTWFTRWDFGSFTLEEQSLRDPSKAGFLARRDGVDILWVLVRNIRRGDGSIDGVYYSDLGAAITNRVQDTVFSH